MESPFRVPSKCPFPLISNEEMAEIEAKERQRGLEEAVRRAGVPERFRAVSLAECPDAIALYAESIRGCKHGGNLVISGSVGAGKTRAACAVALDVIRHGGSVRFASMGKILGRIYDTFGSSESGEGVLSDYASCKLLVLDDLGKERPTEDMLSRLWRLIDGRWSNQKPTVITTNFSRRQLYSRLASCGDAFTADALLDRLCEEGTIFVRMDGASRR